MEDKISDNPKPGLIGKFFLKLRWLWLNYLCFLSLNMLEPWEQAVFNIVIVLVLMTATYSAFLFMPGHFQMLTRNWGYIAN